MRVSERGAGGQPMNRRVVCSPTFWACVLALAACLPAAAAEDYGQAKVNPASLAGRDLAAESRGDVAAALALYSDDAIVQTEPRIGYIEKSSVDRVIVWNIYEVTGDKIAVAALVGQRTDPQTARFIEWFRSQP